MSLNHYAPFLIWFPLRGLTVQANLIAGTPQSRESKAFSINAVDRNSLIEESP